MTIDSQPPLDPSHSALPTTVGAAPGAPLPPLPPIAPPAPPKAKPQRSSSPQAPANVKQPAPPPGEPVWIAQPVAARDDAPPKPAAAKQRRGLETNAKSSDAQLTVGPAYGGDLFHGRRKFVVACLGSSVLHCLLVILLALLSGERPKLRTITLTASADREVPREFPSLDVSASARPVTTGVVAAGESPDALAHALVDSPDLGRMHEDRLARESRVRVTSGNFGSGELLTPVGGSVHGMLDGREGELKRALLGDGGSEAGELAVARGLRWLAAHQREDGSWHFNHLQDGTVCKYCKNPGNHGSTTAATGLALLPFLGSGHTHQKGEYQEVVRKGLEFLKRRTIATPLGGDLQDGVNLYSQGIATLALCEAYALTRDPQLQAPCKEAIRFVVNAQDKNGGGWRYFPGQVGDTTVTGWMLMALKSGQLTYMPITPDVWLAAKRFLDGVQDDGGSAYGYQNPEKNNATMTAIGLLCRMYGGWPRSHAALSRGVRTLSKRGPSEHDLYYDYYATQVMRHYGGEEWIAWNEKMRDFLIESQEREGHATGSWYFADQHGDQGGRLYNTAMAILILEVYYRHLPIYGHRVLGEGFN